MISAKKEVQKMLDQTPTVYIVGFIHGARDLLSAWKREEQPDLD